LDGRYKESKCSSQELFWKGLTVMQWKAWGVQGSVAIALMAAMVGCAPIQPVTPVAGDATSEAGTGATAESTFDDPFAYCAAVGTMDIPDERYTGEELPVVIAEGIRAAYNAEDVALEVYQRSTFWRCMDGKVYACNVGANLPCETKADVSREPTEAMIDFCKENVGADFIPAVVTGRATVYNWRCDDSEPVVAEQHTEVDSQGYLEFVWYELTLPE
jgi:hypothetical protein